MTALRAGPPTYAPPARLSWRVNVVAGVSPDGWPVYEIGPRGGRTSGHLVFLHGGAYFRELRTWHWWFVERLVRETALTVLVPIYPLAPVGTADTIVPAVTDLLRDVLRHPGRSVFVGGDSAGAGMALAVAQELARSDARALAGLVLISPWVDVSCDDPGVAARANLDPWLQAPGRQRIPRFTFGRPPLGQSDPRRPGRPPARAGAQRNPRHPQRRRAPAGRCRGPGRW